MENHDISEGKSDYYYIAIIALVHLILTILVIQIGIAFAIIHAEEIWLSIAINILMPWLGHAYVPNFLFPVWSIINAIAVYYIYRLFYHIARSIFRKASGKFPQ